MAMRVVRGAALIVVALSAWPPIAFGQQSWSVGGLAGTGFPLGIGGVRLSAAGSPTVSVDFDVARVGPGTGLGPLFVMDLRWMRRARAATGNGRYWVFGAAFADHTNTTTLIFPGHHIEYLTKRSGLVIPRIGYGWDHLAPNGVRAGLELTSGAAGEEAGMLLATAFVTWGPPRR